MDLGKPRVRKVRGGGDSLPSIYGKPIDKHSDKYHELRHNALAINAEKLDKRPANPHAWSKQALTKEEKYYLWNSQGGLCARSECGKSLNERTMTIEHIVPKSVANDMTWDIRNMTILCSLCNSKKNNKRVRDIADSTTARPFHYNAMSHVPKKLLDWNGYKD